MNLFSTERPTFTNGVKKLLLDGSIVPSIMIIPKDNGKFHLSVMLRNRDTNESFSYSWHHTELWCHELEKFFVDYREDPEAVLLDHFEWLDQRPTRKTKTQAKPQPYHNSDTDIL